MWANNRVIGANYNNNKIKINSSFYYKSNGFYENGFSSKTPAFVLREKQNTEV